MRLTSWNLLHGMAIPPREGADFTAAIKSIHQISNESASHNSSIYAFQEVDHFLPRSGNSSQIADIADAIGVRDWAFAPSLFGTPGEQWRKLKPDEPRIVTTKDLTIPSYGIGFVSSIPVVQWQRLDLGNSPFGLPLLIPADEEGKVRFIYVRDEPRVALAATLENGYTIINTHLSFVPGFNFAQLARIKRWARKIEMQTNTKAIIVGDLNLPKNLPVLISSLIKGSWRSLIRVNTYPSWTPKIQFDYILARSMSESDIQGVDFPATGVSDHRPIGVQFLGE